MVSLILELVGFALIAGWAIITFGAWGMLVCGLTFVVLANAPTITRMIRAPKDRTP